MNSKESTPDDNKRDDLSTELIERCIRNRFRDHVSTSGMPVTTRLFLDWWRVLLGASASRGPTLESLEQQSLDSLFQIAAVEWWNTICQNLEERATRFGVDGAKVGLKFFGRIARALERKQEIPDIRWIHCCVRNAINDECRSRNRESKRKLVAVSRIDRGTTHYNRDQLIPEECFLSNEMRHDEKGSEGLEEFFFEWLASRPGRNRSLIDQVDFGRSKTGKLYLLLNIRVEFLSQFRGGHDLNERLETSQHFALESLLQADVSAWAEWWIPWSLEEADSVMISGITLGAAWTEVKQITSMEGTSNLLSKLSGRLSSLAGDRVRSNTLSQHLSRMRKVILRCLGESGFTELLNPRTLFHAAVMASGDSRRDLRDATE